MSETDGVRVMSDVVEIEITSEMVLAGVERMRESFGEGSLGSGDAVVVLDILDISLRARKGGGRNSLSSASRQQILSDTLQCL